MVLKQDASTQQYGLANAWNLQVSQEICQDVQAGLNHEWLVTNGLGGYAAGSIVGATTRCYHGLLVASLQPPVKRIVLVTKVDEEVTLPGGVLLRLGVNEYRGGNFAPQGNTYLESVSLEGDIPCFTYRLSETLTLEKRIWMEYGQNTTYVQYVLHGTFEEKEPVDQSQQFLALNLLPFCLSRDYQSVTRGSEDWHFLINSQGNRCEVRAYEGATPCQLIADPSAFFTPTRLWYWRQFHRRDSEHGLIDCEDVYQPGLFRLRLSPGMHKTLVLTAEAKISAELGSHNHEEAVNHALMRHHRRVRQILSVADRSTDNLQLCDPVHARLVVAADQFIVVRPDYASTIRQPLRLAPDRKTIIAGYPWFTDWGRDSMISLPGLLLYTGRYSEARGLLKAFISSLHNGLIPNRFPDNGESPVYNTADATLWMFHALDCYLSITGDWQLLRELFPVLEESMGCHMRGTDYGICMDQRDGLLCAGTADVQLTWMDAKIDNWIVTPRRGKAVEVNALWYAALTVMESWAVHLSIDATLYSRVRSQVREHFSARFWNHSGGYLYDVVDVDGIVGQNDASLRPNQLFAASLAHDLLSDTQTASMLHMVTKHLLTPAGLRSLSPSDQGYQDHFVGDSQQRDSAYHQGTVWQWLIGPYIDVYMRVYNNRRAVILLLQPLVEQLWGTCLGSIGEVAEPESPYISGGCVAQAWSVAELLRCWLIAVG